MNLATRRAQYASTITADHSPVCIHRKVTSTDLGFRNYTKGEAFRSGNYRVQTQNELISTSPPRVPQQSVWPSGENAILVASCRIGECIPSCLDICVPRDKSNTCTLPSFAVNATCMPLGEKPTSPEFLHTPDGCVSSHLNNGRPLSESQSITSVSTRSSMLIKRSESR